MGNIEGCKVCEEGEQESQHKKLKLISREKIKLQFNQDTEGSKSNEPNKFTIESIQDNRYRIEYVNGQMYEGEVKDSKRHGYGVMKWKQGGVYEGNWLSDSANGEGRFQFKGNQYMGTFRNNDLVYAKYASANKLQIYEGEFKDHKYEGKGKLKKEGQYFYQGSFRNGLKNGLGKIYFDSGNEYNGQFVNGKFQGVGIFKSDKHSYEGQFKNGEYHGQGKYKWSSGSVYEGQYEKGQKHGFGIYKKADGSRYEGSWLNGKCHGKGYQITKNGEKTQVFYQNGAKQGQSNDNSNRMKQ